MIFIGVLTALIACAIDIAIEEVSSIKYGTLKEAVDQCTLEGCLIVPFFLWVVWNVVPVLIGSFLVAYIEVRKTRFVTSFLLCRFKDQFL